MTSPQKDKAPEGSQDAPSDAPTSPSAISSPPRNSKGWDGKLRVGKNMEPIEPEVPSPPDSENEETSNIEHVDGGEIDADEDLLDGVDENETDIDLNHSRISSIPALRLNRFKSVIRLCLRQNEVSRIVFPDSWAAATTLEDLDLYDNSISHIKGLDDFLELTSLDLSFNNIKHIKRIGHMKKLKDIYFVQNKISKIEGLEDLTGLTNLELGGNRIREIENLDSLSNLTELYLGKNKITELKNLTPLKSLTLLSIQSNRITSPSLNHLATLPNLTELYISHNALESLAPLSTCTTLRVIDVSSNAITSLAGLEPLSHLEELWASNCQIDSFEEIGTILGDKKDLQTVYFEGNPIQTRQRALYRNKVKLALPGVKQIDATFVRVD